MERIGSFQNSTWQFDNSAYIWYGIGSNLEVDNLKDKDKRQKMMDTLKVKGKNFVNNRKGKINDTK